jgi:hypothetical protein
MPHWSAQYGQCVATVCSITESASSKRHTTPKSSTEALSGLNSCIVQRVVVLKADDLVAVVQMSNKIVEDVRGGGRKLDLKRFDQSIFFINSM